MQVAGFAEAAGIVAERAAGPAGPVEPVALPEAVLAEPAEAVVSRAGSGESRSPAWANRSVLPGRRPDTRLPLAASHFRRLCTS